MTSARRAVKILFVSFCPPGISRQFSLFFVGIREGHSMGNVSFLRVKDPDKNVAAVHREPALK
jgi:hypothetical protein